MPATPTPRRRPRTTTTPKNARSAAANKDKGDTNGYFLSQHSSNPLEVDASSSDDHDDTAAVSKLQLGPSRTTTTTTITATRTTTTTTTRQRRFSDHNIHTFTSDDPLAAYPNAMEEYQKHIAEVIPGIGQTQTRARTRAAPPTPVRRGRGGSRTSTPRKSKRGSTTTTTTAQARSQRADEDNRGEGPSGMRRGVKQQVQARPDVDEDAVMDSESEDELQVVYGQDDTPRKRVVPPSITLTTAVGVYEEEEEEGQEAVKQVRYVDLDEDEVMGYPAEEGEDDDDAVQIPSTRSRSRRRRVVVDEDDDMDGNWVDRDEEQDALPHEPEPGDYQVALNDSPSSYGDELEGQDGEAEANEDEEKDPFDLDSAEELSSLQHKSPDEQDEILCEIMDFTRAVPDLSGKYKLLDRLGTGTFSSVYKAIDLQYHKYDNSPWLGHHPPESSAHYQSEEKGEGRKAFVAIKRIYVTSGPERIKNELVIMEMTRGCRHVSQLVTAFRCEDQVAVVMPYHRNDDFRRFDSRVPSIGACLHTTGGTPAHPHGEYLLKNAYSLDMVQSKQAEARRKCKELPERVGYPDKDPRMPMKANRAGTRGFRAPEVLLKCGQQSGAVDVWSAGIILLFFLTHKFPVFQANDDIEALMEIAAIFGKLKMEKVATLHCRTFATNIPDISSEHMTWREFTERLNPELRVPPEPNPAYYPYTLPSYKARMRDEELGVGLDFDFDSDEDDNVDGEKSVKGKSEDEEDGVGVGMVVDDEDGPPTLDTEVDVSKSTTEPIPIPTKTQSGANPPTSSSPLTPLSGEDSDVGGIERCLGAAKEIVGAASSSVESGVKGARADLKGKGRAQDEDEDEKARAKTKEEEEEERAKAEAKRERREVARQKAIEAAKAKRQAEELEAYKQDVENALDLLEQLLHPISVRRMTPREALAHPFLAEVESQPHSHSSSSSVDLKGKSRATDSFSQSHSSTGSKNGSVKMKNDDDYEPRKFGGGVCGDLHFVDPVTEQPGVIGEEEGDGLVVEVGWGGGRVDLVVRKEHVLL
ncbi:hypothetical protein MD484_g5224, partial [Candolleomyces efflorescens]